MLSDLFVRVLAWIWKVRVWISCVANLQLTSGNWSLTGISGCSVFLAVSKTFDLLNIDFEIGIIEPRLCLGDATCTAGGLLTSFRLVRYQQKQLCRRVYLSFPCAGGFVLSPIFLCWFTFSGFSELEAEF